MRPLLGAISLVGWFLSAMVLAADPPAPRAVLEKALQAHGGERLEKARVLVRTAKGEIASFGAGVTYTGEVSMNLPDQCRWSFELTANKQKLPVILVINGDKGWRSGGGAVKEMSKQELEELREETYLAWLTTLLPLFDSKFELAALPEIKVGNDPAIGIQVRSKGRPDVKFYFDKTTGLLVKTEHKGKEAGLELIKEWLFSDYKEFEGLKLPTKCLILANGRKVADWTATGYKFPHRLDEAVFGKP